MEAVVSGSLGRFFNIWLCFTMIEVKVWSKPLAWTIVEIVLRVEARPRVVIPAQVFHATGFADTLVLTGHMVGHKVDDDLHAGFMGALHQLLKLRHALVYVNGQVRVDIVVVSDGIR